MRSLLAASAKLLATAIKTVGGETVTYRRGNESIDALVVTPVRTRHSDLPLDESRITAREQDFIVTAADLVIGGERTLPQKDDQIDWDDEHGNRRTFTILPRLGDREYRFSDPSRQMIRIFTEERLPNSE